MSVDERQLPKLNVDGSELDGRNIKVNEAQEREPRRGGRGGGDRW